ncbi:response regulator transcription factor [Limihaloglobus sulfuriphilus]|uniref:response regulator transcription factor n=1 Tax=Limihaloglobus sulfuriphilus TaxID=1851148 RepID=UPI001C9A29B9|nr:response regulator transcription factor [Limihaloglobus sulfuriphilus]
MLIVEDEEKIRQALCDFLEFKGFAVAAAADGIEARAAVEAERFDVILLDLMLPKVSGEQLCAMWRKQDIQTPIIMLTAKGREKDKVAGLNSGADDYITKPFSLEELLARVNAVLRRTDPARAVGRAFSFGGWDVDTAALRISRDGRGQTITSREASMIQYFAANPGRVVSREELYRQVWDDDMTGVETRTTDMHIAKLRGKIETDPASPQIIVTVRGAGYMYVD